MKNFLEAALSGAHVVVVGGGGGMGEATAKLAANLGARITIASRSETRLKAAAAEIGGETAIAPVDMTDEAAVKAWARTLDGVDHLVVSASAVARGAFFDLRTNDLRSMIEAKFIGPYVTAREVARGMAAGGSITFFSGVLSRRPAAGATGLAAVNAAVEVLAKGLAQELAGKTRVNCVSPGMVATEAYDAMPEEAREAMFAEVGAALPVGRIGRPEDVAQAAVFAMTNAYLTGAVLDVDGGHLARG